jgi:hypothetical protein
MTTTILKYSISSQGIDVSKNPFHNKIDFSQGIDSVESMPGVLKSINRAQQGLANIGFGKQNEVTIYTLVFFLSGLTLLLVSLFHCLTTGDTSVSMCLHFYLLFISLSYRWRYIRFTVLTLLLVIYFNVLPLAIHPFQCAYPSTCYLFYCLTSGDTSVSMCLPFCLLFILMSPIGDTYIYIFIYSP